MDPAWIELVKVGGPVLAFAAILLFVTLRDKDRMAGQLNLLNAELRDLVKNNTSAMVGLRDILKTRRCLANENRVDEIGDERQAQ